jgi:hypothetical protein
MDTGLMFFFGIFFPVLWIIGRLYEAAGDCGCGLGIDGHGLVPTLERFSRPARK